MGWVIDVSFLCLDCRKRGDKRQIQRKKPVSMLDSTTGKVKKKIYIYIYIYIYMYLYMNEVGSTIYIYMYLYMNEVGSTVRKKSVKEKKE